MVHGDDLISTGTDADLQWFESILKKDFETKTNNIGPEKDDKKELKVLNRIIRYTDEGIELEADLRHAELIVQQLGLQEAKPLTCPAVADEPLKPHDGELLNAQYKQQYQCNINNNTSLLLPGQTIYL